MNTYIIGIIFLNSMNGGPVYLPREDSMLLAKAVKKYAIGTVLDVGTGSGVQAITAASNEGVTEVIAIDINPDALDYAIKNNPHKKINYVQSDLFSNINKTFDTIIFNPPYLPNHPKLKDAALDGGEKGYEISVRFLEGAKNYLNDMGQIIFLFSNLTDKKVIQDTLINNAYLFEEVENEVMDDDEVLHVYKIKKLNSLIKGLNNIKFFSKGKRGLIYTARYGHKTVGIKIKNPVSKTPGRIFIEGNNLKELNKLGVGPKLIDSSDDYLMYEFVEGELISDYLEHATRRELINILIQTFNQMKLLDENNINKEEMSNPYKHIIITKDKKAVLIDFERANKTLKPANVTQFCQYVACDNVNDIINIDKKQLFELARAYKKSYDKAIFDKIIILLK